MKKELGTIPPREEVISALKKRYGYLLGDLKPMELSSTITRGMTELGREFSSRKFMYRKTHHVPKGVKIKSGVEVLYGIHKAPGGLIRTYQEVERDRLRDLGISGDFTLLPKRELTHLENSLKDSERDEGEIIPRVEEFYEETEVQTPGVEPKDFAKAIMEGKHD
jgi:lipoate-protein ligase A